MTYLGFSYIACKVICIKSIYHPTYSISHLDSITWKAQSLLHILGAQSKVETSAALEGLRQRINTLPGKQQRAAANYILQNMELTSYASIQQLAKQARCDEATLVRLAKRLGFKGFPELRRNLRHWYLRSLKPSQVLTEHKPHMGRTPARDVITHDIENLHALREMVDNEALERAASMLAAARRRLVITSGSYAALGLVLAHQCTVIGYHVDLETRMGAYLPSALIDLTPKDLLVLVGFWRITRETILAASWAHKHGIPSLAITDTRFSPLADRCDLALVAPTESISFFQSLLAPLALTYALVENLRRLNPQKAQCSLKNVESNYEYFGTLKV